MFAAYYFNENNEYIPDIICLTEKQMKSVIKCGLAGKNMTRWCIRINDTVYFFNTWGVD